MFQLKKFENYKTFEITTQYNFNALKLHVIYWNSPRVMQNEAMDNNKILYTIVWT